MSRTKNWLFWSAAQAGVSIQEYELAQEALRHQEIEALYYRDPTDAEIEALDVKDPLNELED